MIRLQQVLEAWGRPDFERTLKTSLADLGSELPLQQGLSAGSYAVEKPLDVMLIHAEEQKNAIVAKVGIFYRSLMPGCACAGDPTVEDEQTEYCIAHVMIDKVTAITSIDLVED